METRGEMSLRNIPDHLRPREKLARLGPQGLSDLELITLILGSGQARMPVSTLARSVKKSIDEGHEPELNHLMRIRGLGLAGSARILAALEWGQRQTQNRNTVLNHPDRIAERLHDIRLRRQEHFVLFTLNGAHQLIRRHTVFVGTLNQSLVHPREIFALALEERAAAMIVAHNHPSGALTPSRQDLALTERLLQAADLLGIPLLDHVIVSSQGHISLREAEPGLFISRPY